MKTIFITGATDGLGKATALKLASQGYELILHGRNPKKGKQLVSEITAHTNNARLHYYNADFADLAEVKNLARQIRLKHSHLHTLINNAGLGVETSRRESKNGLEMIFQVDYLATYVLSQMLLPLLKKLPQGQIINVASAGQAPIDFDDPLLTKSWTGIQAYCQAKLGQIMLAFEMAAQHPDMLINALHPASYMPTKIVTHMFTPQSKISDGVASMEALVSNTKDTGKYFFQTREDQAMSQAYHHKARQQLMELSRNLTGV
jgi:NAD(P)-dependent dehydrogenase (short-subunit alcohol dehydrogenase family)